MVKFYNLYVNVIHGIKMWSDTRNINTTGAKIPVEVVSSFL